MIARRGHREASGDRRNDSRRSAIIIEGGCGVGSGKKRKRERRREDERATGKGQRGWRARTEKERKADREAARDDEKFDRTQRAQCTVVHPPPPPSTPPPTRPIHPIIPPALYDQSILFYTASHETSRPRWLDRSFDAPTLSPATADALAGPPSHPRAPPFATEPRRNSFAFDVGFSFPIERPPALHRSYFRISRLPVSGRSTVLFRGVGLIGGYTSVLDTWGARCSFLQQSPPVFLSIPVDPSFSHHRDAP